MVGGCEKGKRRKVQREEGGRVERQEGVENEDKIKRAREGKERGKKEEGC